MAGVTDLAFRTICRELGAAYTITEMVSAKALCYQDKKTLPLMELGPEEHPGGVQIFGSDLACMKEGAAIIREVAHPDIIDINMGCPVPKVANNGDGSGLLRDLDKACRVAEAVIRGAQGTPVTVKMRLGWDKGNIVCLDLAKMLESVGVAAITLHGRTKVQMYSGTANWDYIREVKQALSIPVIANGDVFSGQDAARILRYTGADGVMIARGVFGNPWIFQQAAAHEVMAKYGVVHESWGPFAEGRKDFFTNPTLQAIGAKYGKSVAQTALRFLIQSDVVVIPKSTHKERIAENLAVFDFQLSQEDMVAIRALDDGQSAFFSHYDPATVEFLTSLGR